MERRKIRKIIKGKENSALNSNTFSFSQRFILSQIEYNP